MTIYNEQEIDDFIKCCGDEFKYWSYQEEKCPKTERIHLQAYAGFEERKRFKEIKKRWPTAHIELAKSYLHAFDYCQKAESRVDGGRTGCSERPATGGARGAWESALEDIKSGMEWEQLIASHIKLYAQYEYGLRKLYERFRPVSINPDRRLVTILFGPPGVGKSTACQDKIGARPHFRACHGKWFDGYNYERIVWIDDFSPAMMDRAALLQLMEGKFRMQVKGGFTMVEIDELYITSNWHPSEWFPEKNKNDQDERAQAIIRRATVLHVTNNDVVTVTACLGNTSLDMLSKKRKTIMDFWEKDD